MLPALAILGAGAMASAASVYNNQRNIQFQKESNDTQIGLANTAHQREVRDLIAAGLNPVLSANGSGAAVPQLGTPTLDNAARGLSDSIQSAAKLQSLDIPLKQSQTMVNSAQAHNLMAQGKLFDAQADAIATAQDLKEDMSYAAETFGGWLGEKWANLFGDKTPESVGVSHRTMDWLLRQPPEMQDKYFETLHRLRKERKY